MMVSFPGSGEKKWAKSFFFYYTGMISLYFIDSIEMSNLYQNESPLIGVCVSFKHAQIPLPYCKVKQKSLRQDGALIRG